MCPPRRPYQPEATKSLKFDFTERHSIKPGAHRHDCNTQLNRVRMNTVSLPPASGRGEGIFITTGLQTPQAFHASYRISSQRPYL